MKHETKFNAATENVIVYWWHRREGGKGQRIEGLDKLSACIVQNFEIGLPFPLYEDKRHIQDYWYEWSRCLWTVCSPRMRHEHSNSILFRPCSRLCDLSLCLCTILRSKTSERSSNSYSVSISGMPYCMWRGYFELSLPLLRWQPRQSARRPSPLFCWKDYDFSIS